MPAPPWTQKIGGLEPFGWIGTSDVQRLSFVLPPSSSSASLSIVGAWKTAPSGSVVPSSRSSRANSRAATIEVAPRSKKSSVTPIGLISSSRSQMRTSRSSSGVRGATIVSSAERSLDGAGSALRSILPFGVSGSSSSTTTLEGTMYAGRMSVSARRRSAGTGSRPSAGTT